MKLFGKGLNPVQPLPSHARSKYEYSKDITPFMLVTVA